MLGLDDSDHRWHQLPGLVACYAVGHAASIVFLPVVFIEPLLGGAPITSDTRLSVAKVIVIGPAITCGYLAAAPFFVLGLPFEFLSGEDEHAAAAPEQQPPSK